MARSRRARWKNGRYSESFRAHRAAARLRWLTLRDAVGRLGLSAGIKTFERLPPMVIRR